VGADGVNDGLELHRNSDQNDTPLVVAFLVAVGGGLSGLGRTQPDYIRVPYPTRTD
jgi:hypothetical protein